MNVPDPFNRAVLAWLRVYAAAVLTYVLAALVDGRPLDPRAGLIAGAVAVLPVVINWLNPGDARYGRGSEPK